MASFAGLGYTLAAGTVVSTLAISIFGKAVKSQQEGVAPRCAARPKDTIYCECETLIHKVQDRGNPWFGWIIWTLSFTYETLLRGVPGTGTRKNGLEGVMLSMNLDAIIFLRFNALCLRVASLTTILAISVILPANWTADPYVTTFSYNRTTLANIPVLNNNHHNITIQDVLTPVRLFPKLYANLGAEMPIQARLYAIVICSWIVTYFCCVEINKEWRDNLALRRKYYLEADHYKKEKKDQEEKQLERVDYISKRDPWVQNPEQPCTVTNIELYSLLVGNVPPLPKELLIEGYSEQQEIDWQTATAATFFDNCVPNQPGYTSSVAVITILPSASKLNAAWEEWNKVASALRELRCIRSTLAERYVSPLEKPNITRRQLLEKSKEQNLSTKRNIFLNVENSKSIANMNSDERILYFADYDEDVESQLMEALHYGPQQKSIYSREFAQASASTFRNYLVSSKYQRASNLQLAEFEEEALLEVEEANKSLQKAQFDTIQKKKANILPIPSAVKLEVSTFALPSLNRGVSALSLVDEEYEEYEPTMASLTTSLGKKKILKILSITPDYQDDTISITKENDSPWNSGKWTSSNPMRGSMSRICQNLNYFFIKGPKKCSRQAAVAARQCLADGRGGIHWNELVDIPVPPLADAPLCSLRVRDCLRPVTVTIPKQIQVLRNWLKNVLLILINIFYTFPLTALAGLSNGSALSSNLSNHNAKLDGLIYAALYTLFVSVCPYMFEYIACWGSNASSLSRAELAAMRYYWLFILMTSFISVTIMNSIGPALKMEDNSNFFYSVVRSISCTIPISVSFNWINIIIKNTTFTMPVFYLLQTHSSIFSLVGCKKIGMHSSYVAGSPLPYRAYIDCGTVLLCTVALSFASPLVAPFAAFFFLISQPIMRRCFIYVYLPEFDGGGFRWPFLSDMCYSSMFLGQILLVFMISFKLAIGPAIASCVTLIPTALFRRLTLDRYYRAYADTSLLQTSFLDMSSSTKQTSLEEREDFRKFLVDAHKAAYIPVCIAGSATSILTVEPAVAVPTNQDLVERTNSIDSFSTKRSHTLQRGANLRGLGSTSLSRRGLTTEESIKL